MILKNSPEITQRNIILQELISNIFYIAHKLSVFYKVEALLKINFEFKIVADLDKQLLRNVTEYSEAIDCC
jgi:hypothetical protein